MIRNITLSADENMIKAAREVSRKEKRSLNDAFREWLAFYISRDTAEKNYDKIMGRLSYVKPGKKFSREEMNAR